MKRSRYGVYKVFNYKNTLNKNFYKKDTKNGTHPWFFEPDNYKKKEPCSYGYATIDDALQEANVWECEFLLKYNRLKLKKTLSMYDEIRRKDKDKLISKDSLYDREMLNNFYITLSQLIKFYDEKIIELLEWKDTLEC